MRDEDIDYSDSPKLTAEQLARAVLVEPRVMNGATVTVHVDPKVAAWYQKQGAEMHRRLRAALEIYASAHES